MLKWPKSKFEQTKLDFFHYTYGPMLYVVPDLLYIQCDRLSGRSHQNSCSFI